MDLVISQKQKSFAPLLLILGGGLLLLKFWPKMRTEWLFYRTNRHIKKLSQHEENQVAPFPKEVDLEPWSPS